ncbi:MAG: large conductance mechanosensitive channel protein MscL [Phascolarctobacterium sp.]|nr:MAG: large conductance mechanosensitive channel protein MscL [Phascolarctobacterium sp.]
MSFFNEFKNFAMRGNVLDMAIGVVIGGAFGQITTSLVNNIIMPPIGMLLGKIDFSNLFITLDGKQYDSLKAATDAGAPVLSYGLFINTVINFLIIAFAVFIVIRQINRFRPKPEPAPAPRLCPYCRQPVADDATRCPHCTSEL